MDVFIAPNDSPNAQRLAQLLQESGCTVDVYKPVSVTRYGPVFGFQDRLNAAKVVVVFLQGAWPSWLRASDDVSRAQATTWLDMENLVDVSLEKPRSALLVLDGVDRQAFVTAYSGGVPSIEGDLNRTLISMPETGVAGLVARTLALLGRSSSTGR
jgi:hypothetical protein